MTDFIPYGRQSIQSEDIECVVQTLKSDYLTQGPLVETFEAKLAETLQVSHAIVVSNGTAALHLASLALGLQKGDAVLVPAISFVATANAVLYAQATPVFCDVDPDTACIDLNSAELAMQLANKQGLKVRALYAMHYAGRPCNIAALSAFCKKHHLKLLEDSCHALGASYRSNSNETWKSIGADADLNILSFHPVKHITSAEGGAITTNCDKLAKKIKLLRNHGVSKEPEDFQQNILARDEKSGDANPWYYEMLELGFNYRLPDLLCALGISQLSRLKTFVEKRRHIAQYYQRALATIKTISLPPVDSELLKQCYHLYPLKIDFKGLGKSRKQVMDELKKMGVGSQVHYLPIPLQTYYQKNKNLFLSTAIPHAETFYQAELSIPMYPDLTALQQQQVVAALSKVCAV